MRTIAGKFVPRFPSNDQRDRRVKFFSEVRETVADYLDVFFNTITGDRIRVYHSETKRQSS